MQVTIDHEIIIHHRLLLDTNQDGILQITEICGDEVIQQHRIHIDNDHVQIDIMCQQLWNGKKYIFYFKIGN